jgi:hypothetical protein
MNSTTLKDAKVVTDTYAERKEMPKQLECIDPKDLAYQQQCFQKGNPSLTLDRPCAIGDGIAKISEKDKQAYIDVFQQFQKENTSQSIPPVVKFVPASGAATRMFQDWSCAYKSLEGGTFSAQDFPKLQTFVENLPQYAFYFNWKTLLQSQGEDLDKWIQEKDIPSILRWIFSEKGPQYPQLPKGLIPFHCYKGREATESHTPISEHLEEALHYSKDSQNRIHIHFTVSPEHRKSIEEEIQVVSQKALFSEHTICWSLSEQDPATNTLARTVEDNEWVFQAEDGTEQALPLLRPGGHGGLLKNLSVLEGQIVFIKNIDNVCHNRMRQSTYDYKMLLGGVLLSIREQCFKHLTELERVLNQQPSDSEVPDILERAASFAQSTFHSPSPKQEATWQERAEHWFQQLHKPVRVCGMVLNTGAPGGGPFWVTSRKNHTTSLQIVEKSQVDTSNSKQKEIFEQSTHFNPVDIVCSKVDHKGNVFDLTQFSDPDTYFIAEKSYQGSPIYALERPGLWNGAMAHWNTLFVEVPKETFTPVKEVYDLATPPHQP